MSLEVQLYDSKFKQGVIELNLREYPFMQPWFSTRFQALYESIEQSERNQIFLAIESDQLAGVFSYVHWPFTDGSDNLKSYVALGLLVAPEFRGKGVFGKILDKLSESATLDKADIMCAFPVKISKPGFVRKGWSHVLDLHWYVRPLNPFTFMRNKDRSSLVFNTTVPDDIQTDDWLQTAADPKFWKYRENLMPAWTTYWFRFTTSTSPVYIAFRLQKRLGLNEAVIGKIFAGNHTQKTISEALKNFIAELKKEGNISFVSCAINPICEAPSVSAIKSSFIKTNKIIHFVNKSFTGFSEGLKAERWNLMRADLETW